MMHQDKITDQNHSMTSDAACKAGRADGKLDIVARKEQGHERPRHRTTDLEGVALEAGGEASDSDTSESSEAAVLSRSTTEPLQEAHDELSPARTRAAYKAEELAPRQRSTRTGTVPARVRVKKMRSSYEVDADAVQGAVEHDEFEVFATQERALCVAMRRECHFEETFAIGRVRPSPKRRVLLSSDIDTPGKVVKEEVVCYRPRAAYNTIIGAAIQRSYDRSSAACLLCKNPVSVRFCVLAEST